MKVSPFIVYFAIISIFAIILSSKLNKDIDLAEESKYWKETTIVINRFDAVKHSNGTGKGSDDYYTIGLEYKYMVNNIEYTGSEYQYGGPSEGVESLAARHKGVTESVAFYNPAKPSQSVMVRGLSETSHTVYLVLVGIPYIMLFLFFVSSLYETIKHRKKRTVVNESK